MLIPTLEGTVDEISLRLKVRPLRSPGEYGLIESCPRMCQRISIIHTYSRGMAMKPPPTPQQCHSCSWGKKTNKTGMLMWLNSKEHPLPEQCRGISVFHLFSYFFSFNFSVALPVEDRLNWGPVPSWPLLVGSCIALLIIIIIIDLSA